jgi:hypothetical protein
VSSKWSLKNWNRIESGTNNRMNIEQDWLLRIGIYCVLGENIDLKLAFKFSEHSRLAVELSDSSLFHFPNRSKPRYSNL